MEKQKQRTENRLMHVGRGEERVRRMERATWKLILPYVKASQWNLLYDSGTQTGVCNKLEG